MANFKVNNKVRIQRSIFLAWLLCHVIYGPLTGSDAWKLDKFIKVQVDQVLCSSDLLLLTESPSKEPQCARACLKQQGCLRFIFTPLGTDVGPGICSWCPAYSIRGVTFTSIHSPMKIWTLVSNYLLSPPADMSWLPIPGVLYAGRSLIIRGTVPAQPPSKLWFSLIHHNSDIVFQPMAVFDKGNVKKRMYFGYRVGPKWHSNPLAKGIFPYAAGQDFEIFVLVTIEGFITYINGMFITTMNSKEQMEGEIGYINFGQDPVEFKVAIY